MHPDRKIGIAMGILLVGVVAALFFRNEPLPVDEGLSINREQELNQKLRDRDVAVYLDPETDVIAEVDGVEPQWTLPELFEQVRNADRVPIPIGAAEPVPTPVEEPVAPVVKRDPSRFTPPTETARRENPTVPSTSGTDDLTAMKDALNSSLEASGGQSAGSDSDQLQEYTVKFGDTLSEISERFLGSQNRYREIYELNKDRMSSPDRLRVGHAIRVPRIIR